MSEWISVKDRLPEINISVIVFGDDIVTIACYNEKYKSDYCCGFWDELNTDIDGSQTDMQNVTHWMPLPEPPK